MLLQTVDVCEVVTSGSTGDCMLLRAAVLAAARKYCCSRYTQYISSRQSQYRWWEQLAVVAYTERTPHPHRYQCCEEMQIKDAAAHRALTQ
jgi:hypothetical protein